MAAQKILLLLLLFMSIKALSTLVSTNETSEKREARSNLRVCNSIRATIQQQLTGWLPLFIGYHFGLVRGRQSIKPFCHYYYSAAFA